MRRMVEDAGDWRAGLLPSRGVRLASLIAVSMLAACTETPSSFPPCVDPNAPCVAPEAGADASDAGVPDAATRAIPADAP